jgi:uncharacterized protein YkwD
VHRPWGKTLALAAIVAVLLLALVPGAPASQTRTSKQMQVLQAGILQQLNALRASHHLKPLVLSRSLSTAAGNHNSEMASAGFFSHDSKNGSAFWKRIKRFYNSSGYGYWSVGENLLWASPDVDPAGALKMWLDSPEHKKNMLDPQWHEIGIAALHAPSAGGVFGGNEVTIVTTDFGIRR